jgi:hypothetical protein
VYGDRSESVHFAVHVSPTGVGSGSPEAEEEAVDEDEEALGELDEEEEVISESAANAVAASSAGMRARNLIAI